MGRVRIPIHLNMPVILPRDMEEFWLDRDVRDAVALLDVLRPYPPDRMNAYRVSTLVNSARNNGPEILTPVG